MGSTTSTKFKKLRLQIASELLALGLVKSSAEYKRRLIRELRARSPAYRARERAKWKAYYQRQGKDWNNKRVSAWRHLNPARWKALMKRASEKGLYERHYAKYRERIKREKSEYGKRIRRSDPLFGFRGTLAEYRRGTITFDQLFERCGSALAFLDGQNEGTGSERK